MKRLLSVVILFTLCAVAFAEETWLGIYMQGQKIGYSSYATFDGGPTGHPGKRTESLTVMDSKMLGASLNLRVKSTTYLDSNGRTLQMMVEQESGGRKQTLDARFGPTTIQIDLDNGGSKTKRNIPLPKDGAVLDDAVTALLNGTQIPVGKKITFYVLDPMTVSLVKNTATYLGKAKVSVGGKEFDSDEILIDDPRAATKVFMSSKGDLIKMEGPLGLEMIPEVKEVAMAVGGGMADLRKDIALATAIKTDKPIADPWKASFLKLHVTGLELDKMKSDEHQTVRKVEEGWVIEVHPAISSGRSTIVASAKSQPAWTQPSLHIPSDSLAFRQLAKKIIGKETAVIPAAKRVKEYVYSIMTPNAGIGVLRDASEVLKTKEGVCRDYAILTAALLRAGRIPAKVASGMVYAEGSFYYHAWVEYWDGKHWIGLDSTRPESNFSATHVKIKDGSVEQAFQFFVLDGARIEVVEVHH